MALEIHHVAGVVLRAGMEEMIKAHLVQRGGGSKRRNMPAQTGIVFVGPMHHRHRVPAYQTFDAAFDFQIAGVMRLFADGNRVDVRRVGGKGRGHSAMIRPFLKHYQKFLQLLGTVAVQHIIQRFKPLIHLFGINPRDSQIF